MGDTRSCGNALSILLYSFAVRAGCSGTLDKEMPDKPLVNGNGQTTQPAAPQRKTTSDGLISEPQVNRLFGLTKGAGKTREALGVILAAFNYTAPDGDLEAAARQVRREDFDKIQEAIQKP